MKILYAGTISPNDSALYRLWTLERLGHTVVRLDMLAYAPGNPLLRKLAFHLAAGPQVTRFNRDLLEMAEREKPDMLWGDKLLWLQPKTLVRLRRMGIVTVSYMIDNPFGPRRDPGWQLYMKDIPLFDLHVVQRDRNLVEYREHGARDVMKIQTAYEPTIHYPAPAGWSDADRTRGVSFIGTPYDDRARFLTRLWKEFGLPVVVSGNRVWASALGREAAAAIYAVPGELYNDAYREGIWRSKINLSFITHSNQDEFVHKSFEVAGCGGFLLAERSAGHLARFEEDVEAVFFSTVEECAEKCRRYLGDEDGRARIAAAGHARAERDGYHNDRQVGLIAARAEALLGDVKRAAGVAG